MYIVPRPTFEDDPLFPIRVSTAAILGLIAAAIIDTPVPTLFPTVLFGMLAGQRQAFNPAKALAGPILMIVLVLLMATIISLTRPMPAVLLCLLFMIFFGAYYLILKTGNPLGMLLLIVAVLTSTMGMYSLEAMNGLATSCYKACGIALLVIPPLYMIFPPRTKLIFDPTYTAAEGGEYGKRAFIRACVMMLLSFWLYAVLDVGNLIYAIAAVFVTVFPTRSTLFQEVKERCYATLIGGIFAIAVMLIFGWLSHPPILLCMLALSGLFFSYKMMAGYYPPMVYQFAFSVTLALVVGSLSTQSPWDAALARIVFTVFGAVTAALLTSFLELRFLKKSTLQSVNPTFKKDPPAYQQSLKGN